jgi:(2Fe-2S) ferredoxin
MPDCGNACHGGCALQVFILDALVNYQVQDSKDAEKIVERVLPRLQHVNSAVVLSAAKVRGAPSSKCISLHSSWHQCRECCMSACLCCAR